MDRKYIFVTGGVVSSLGKGITTSSIGALLRARGYRVTAVKIDPYVNVDAGTMRPYEHGEVFVTESERMVTARANRSRFFEAPITSPAPPFSCCR